MRIFRITKPLLNQEFILRLFTKPFLNYNICRRVEGDVAALREELSEYLFEKYEQVILGLLVQTVHVTWILDYDLFKRFNSISNWFQEFISQANELMQKVVFRGNFDADFKEFLKMKGFWENRNLSPTFLLCLNIITDKMQ